MNVKLRVLSAGALFFLGQVAYAQSTKRDTATKETKIEEVVLTGAFGTKLTPEQSIGSTSTVKAAELEKPAAISIDNVLQGKVAGLYSSASSGQPGASTITLIRGLTSLTGNNEPLYVIDGVAVQSGDIAGALTSQNALSLINPSDIEDIQVLKDGVSTALYGSRGAAGVVLIRTKSGKKGKSQINFISEIGGSSVAFEKFKMTNAYENTKLFGLGLYNSGNASSLQEGYDIAKSEFDWDGVTDTDWNKLARRNTPSYNRYNFSYTGGTENFKIFSSLGYLKQEGLARNADFQRYSGSLKGDWNASDKLKMHFNINLSRSIQTGATDGSSYSNPIFSSRLLSPTQKPYNADGSYNTNLYFLNPEFNPIGIENENIEKGTFDKVISSVGADYKILPYLTFSTNFAIDNTQSREMIYYNPDFGDGNFDGDVKGNGYLYGYNKNLFTWDWYSFLHFNKKFGEKHDVSASIGIESYVTENNNSNWDAQGFPAGTRIPYAAVAANPSSTPSSNFTRITDVGYMGRFAYTYDKFVTLSGSFRREGNSIFSDYWGNFYGVGASVNLTNLNILNNVFRNLVVRGSIGQNGNPSLTAYQKAALYAYSGDYLASNAGYIFQTGAYPGERLKWEVSEKVNLGVDFSTKGNNNLYGTVDFFKNSNKDQLLSFPIPTSGSGFTGITRNLGSTVSQGIETTLGFRRNTENFSFDTKFLYTYNENVIKSLGAGGATTIVRNGSKAWAVDHNPTEYYLRLWAGVDPKNGDPLWYTDETRTATTNSSSIAKQVFTGRSALPKHMLNWQTDMEYKNFKLSFQFNFLGGYSVYDRWAFIYDGDGQYANVNAFSDALYNSWTPDNPNATRPKYVFGGNRNSTAASDRFLYDGDHIRLRQVELGYKFTKNVLNIDGVNGIYVYVRGVNLWTYAFDKRLYFDPEANSNAWTYTSENMGIYDQTQPNMRQYIMGVSIDF
ncbi:SusC/RagA family TonB-linked outer membrane protein [Chryseobacterium sp. G0162]|uniref:SusC/RagA family TonB-linked outer membrane protein n=1 Tax=Chryseobacterium sp. G0162 TaxID=2487063 RepID=UPI000F4DB50C|nr:SusC/RagA family TonB-linked outer membrane protein [Chryseobacterium sp. G0162]AZB09068.1 SusC/RagA family TonB-linked outer membrane protein [Chryseobacterium sp. G0162]